MHDIAIIAAIGKNRELGLEGKLPWHIRDDMQRFKTLTMGHPVIMGRKTWESIPEKFRPLPGRTNIVVTRQKSYLAPDADIAASLDAAIHVAENAQGCEEIFIIGGGELYREALPLADRFYLTLVDDAVKADTFFPQYEDTFTKKISEELRESNGLLYRWIELTK